MDIKRIVLLLFAGNSIFTIKNEKTKNHYTFRVKKPRSAAARVWNISVMGPYNNWLYMFTLRNGNYHFSDWYSRVKPEDIRVKAFIWFLNALNRERLPDKLSVQFSNHCCRCGRRLTDVESIKANVGPECRKYINTER